MSPSPKSRYLARCLRGFPSVPGQPHLKASKDLEEIDSIPAGLLPLAFDAASLGLLLLEQVERHPCGGTRPEHGEVLGGIPFTDPALVLVKADIEDPMDPVFDAPKAAAERG